MDLAQPAIWVNAVDASDKLLCNRQTPDRTCRPVNDFQVLTRKEGAQDLAVNCDFKPKCNHGWHFRLSHKPPRNRNVAACMRLLGGQDKYLVNVYGAFTMRSLFHLAFHVRDLQAARHFYGTVLGCREGRSTDTWVDFDFFGHQISLHLGQPFATTNTGKVGEHMVPMPHLGVILQMADWQDLASQLIAHGVAFVLTPSIRFAGEPGEQATMFFLDPSGNPIEIKGFESLEGVFAT